MQDDLHLDDAALVNFHHVEGEALVLDAFALCGEIALYLKQEAGKRFGLAFDGLEVIVVEAKYLYKVGHKCLGLKDVGVLVEPLVGLLFVVVFVVYLPDDFLQNVFHCDDSACASELIHHDGDVYFVRLEVAQKVVHHLRFRHEVGGTNQRLPPESLRLAQMRQEVLDVEHAFDVILRVLIDGDAAVVVCHDASQHVVERSLDVEIHNIDAARHYLFRHLAAEANDALQHAGFLGDVLLVGQLHSLLQVIHGEHLGLVTDETLRDDFASDEQTA